MLGDGNSNKGFVINDRTLLSLCAEKLATHKNTEYLADYIAARPESGYRLAGIVAGRKYIPKDLKTKQYSSLKDALKEPKWM